MEHVPARRRPLPDPAPPGRRQAPASGQDARAGAPRLDLGEPSGPVGPFPPVVGHALEAAFGPEIRGLEVHRGEDEKNRRISALAHTEGRRISLSSAVKEDIRDLRSMEILAHEVSHALAGPGTGEFEVDQPGDPGEAAAREAGRGFIVTLSSGAQGSGFMYPRAGRARVQRTGQGEQTDQTIKVGQNQYDKVDGMDDTFRKRGGCLYLKTKPVAYFYFLKGGRESRHFSTELEALAEAEIELPGVVNCASNKSNSPGLYSLDKPPYVDQPASNAPIMGGKMSASVEMPNKLPKDWFDGLAGLFEKMTAIYESDEKMTTVGGEMSIPLISGKNLPEVSKVIPFVWGVVGVKIEAGFMISLDVILKVVGKTMVDGATWIECVFGSGAELGVGLVVGPSVGVDAANAAVGVKFKGGFSAREETGAAVTLGRDIKPAIPIDVAGEAKATLSFVVSAELAKTIKGGVEWPVDELKIATFYMEGLLTEDKPDLKLEFDFTLVEELESRLKGVDFDSPCKL